VNIVDIYIRCGKWKDQEFISGAPQDLQTGPTIGATALKIAVFYHPCLLAYFFTLKQFVNIFSFSKGERLNLTFTK